MRDVFICDAVRTPIGRYGGMLSSVRPDDLIALVIKSLTERNKQIDWQQINDVLIGCANQAGEDNRNVARMGLLLAGLSETISGATINRLCGSGMDAIGTAFRSIRAGEAELIIAGGVESMSRAPYVMEKSTEAFSRNIKMYDTTLGWRFINKALEKKIGCDSMMETAENLATEYKISREDQDIFAAWSQQKTFDAQNNGFFADEIMEVSIPQTKAEPLVFAKDEHPRLTAFDKLSQLKPLVNANGTVTAGNSSGINDGACALIIASEEAVKKFGLQPLAKILGMDTAGVLPKFMGIGPVPATNKILQRLNIKLDDIDILEINEAFAAQVLACTRLLNLSDNDSRINPQGGAIALGHPLGMSGARLITTAVYQLKRTNKKKALCTMCIGVGQGIAMIIERV
jgi:3-oxoadipyl-CoA thiolase